MRTALALCGLCALCGTPGPVLAREPDALLVKRVSGDVRMTRGTETREAKAGDLPDSGTTFVTGAGGALELRFHPDFMSLHVAGASGARLRVDYPRADSGARRVSLASGRVVGDLSRQGPGLVLEDARSEARVREGRLAFATDSAGTTVLVLEGEAEVRPRGAPGASGAAAAARTVTRGQKAFLASGAALGPDASRGFTVTRAGAAELAEAGLGQNRLEVDFWDPATEEFRTLEVEYERRP